MAFAQSGNSGSILLCAAESLRSRPSSRIWRNVEGRESTNNDPKRGSRLLHICKHARVDAQDSWLASNAGYSVKKKEVSASFRGLRKDLAALNKLDSVTDYLLMLDQLKIWNKEGKSDLRMDLTVVVTSPVTAPLASARAPRRTATASQLSQLQANNSGAPDLKTAIIERWRCTNTRCDNHPFNCWIRGVDDKAARNHRPIYQQAMLAWCESIKKGDSTVDLPAAEVVDKLATMRAKGALDSDSATNNRRRSGQQQQQTPYIHFAPVYHGGSSSNTVSNRQIVPLSSSPSKWSYSSQADVSVEVEGFLRFLRRQAAWVTKQADIDDIRRVCIDQKDLSLQQVYRMTVEKWTEAGLKEGQKERVNEAIKAYRKREIEADIDDLSD